MDAIESAGGRVFEITEDEAGGPDVVSLRYCVTKRRAPEEENLPTPEIRVT